MINVRLIDHEGQTVLNASTTGERPEPYILMAAESKVRFDWNPEELPSVFGPEIPIIKYGLDGRDGGGTYIYRRVTPLWKEEK